MASHGVTWIFRSSDTICLMSSIYTRVSCVASLGRCATRSSAKQYRRPASPFSQAGRKSCLFYENKERSEYVFIIPLGDISRTFTYNDCMEISLIIFAVLILVVNAALFFIML